MTKFTPEQEAIAETEWADLTAIDAFLRLFGYMLAVSLSTREIAIIEIATNKTAATYTYEYFAHGGEAARRQFALEVVRLVGGLPSAE